MRSLAVTLALAPTLLGGCESFPNPHLEFEHEFEVEDPNNGSRTVNIGANPSLQDAVIYANSVKEKYREALGEQAEFRNWLGVGLIPLGAATFGLGITGASTDSIVVTGLTGAASFGVGTWIQNVSREQAYVLGHNAVNCAIKAVIPLHVDDDDQFREAFKTALFSLSNGISGMHGLIDRADTDGSQEIKNAVTAAEDAIAKAKAARQQGFRLERQLQTVADHLVAAVDRIIGEVDSALVNNRASLETLSSIIGGLGQVYGRFTTVPEPEGAVSEDDLEAALALPAADEAVRADTLRGATAALRAKTLNVTDFVNVIAESKPLDALKECGVDPADVATALSLEPPGPINVGTGAPTTKLVIIRGGRTPYAARLVGGEDAGIEVSQMEPFGPTVAIEVAEDATPGTYSVLIADQAGRRKALELVVEAGGS